jgi:glycosyltransferase involved in cell wall biosynthesis
MRTLAAAWPLVQREATLLKLLGTMDEDSRQAFSSSPRSDVILKPAAPYGELIRELQSAAVVVVPQDNTPQSVGQLPMKLLDAMAAACPIVASDVGDIPRWLRDGAGLCVPPGDPQSLAAGIQQMLDDPSFATHCGQAARERVERLGAFDVVGPRLRDVVWDVLKGRPRIDAPAFSSIDNGMRHELRAGK